MSCPKRERCRTPRGRRAAGSPGRRARPSWYATRSQARSTSSRCRSGERACSHRVFLSDRRIAAVVSAPPDDRVPEGERLGDLWATEVSGTRWRRLTHFRAGGDRWVTDPDPDRSSGWHRFRASQRARRRRPKHPTFELWRFEHGAASLVRRLDGERYLAGRLRGRLVWSRPDQMHGRHLLQVERAGEMHTIGCGAVLVDPIDVVDPDRRDRGLVRAAPWGSAGRQREPEMPAPKRSR